MIRNWSVGIFSGPSPLELRPHPGVANPVLSKSDIHDVDARLVADPFLIQRDGVWHLFVEILPEVDRVGVIGHATSPDGVHWTYQGVVLREAFHLSYPLVFEHQGHVYMVPETLDAGGVTLYRAERFPNDWRPVTQLVPGAHADPSLFQHQGRWWMFTCPRPYQHNILALYSAPALEGPWTEHPQSPVHDGEAWRCRPAGRVVRIDGVLHRFSQDCVDGYGMAVNAFSIATCSDQDYADARVGDAPVLAGSGQGWNLARMHHVDAHQLPDGTWLACVDGRDI